MNGDPQMLSTKTASHFLPKKILLPVDFSPSSYAALQVGTDLARHFGAELILLTVVPMFSADKISDEFISTFSPDSYSGPRNSDQAIS